MKVSFYLKRPESTTATTIFSLINYESQSVKVYIGESILPKFWNPATQAARVTPKFTEAPEFNQRLNNIRSTISRVFIDYRNRYDHEAPSPAVLKSLIEAALKRRVVKNNFIEYFEDFVRRSFNGQRIDPRSRLPIRRGVAKVYQSTLNNIKDFAKTYKRKIDFDTIDLEFHADFTKWLSSSPRLLSINTIGSNFQRIKAVLAEATEKGINSNMTFKSKYFIKQSEDADTIYLNPAELKQMQKLDLKDNSTLDRVRDLFLIGAYTGLRYSDFSVLQPKNITDGFIRIAQSKTGGIVVIPVHPVVNTIVKKYKGNLPQPLSNQKMNFYLKDIGKEMSLLKKNETRRITRGSTKVATNYEKWQLLTTHAARRSFITNEYNAGTPPITIRAISGHKSEASFLKYLRVTSDDHAQKIKELWDSRGKKKGKVVSMTA